MKRNLGDLAIFSCLVFLTVAMSLLPDSKTTEIQVHDAYFVVDRLTLAFLTLGPLVSIVFFPLAAIRKFNAISTNIALIVGLVIVAVIFYQAIELQSSYSQEIGDLRDEQLPDRSRYLNNIRVGLNWSRAILTLIVVPTTLLIYRTVRIWKEAHSRPQL